MQDIYFITPPCANHCKASQMMSKNPVPVKQFGEINEEVIFYLILIQLIHYFFNCFSKGNKNYIDRISDAHKLTAFL